MAKFRAAKGRKTTTGGPASSGAWSCLTLLILAFLLFSIVMYYGLKGG